MHTPGRRLRSRRGTSGRRLSTRTRSSSRRLTVMGVIGEPASRHAAKASITIRGFHIARRLPHVRRHVPDRGRRSPVGDYPPPVGKCVRHRRELLEKRQHPLSNHRLELATVQRDSAPGRAQSHGAVDRELGKPISVDAPAEASPGKQGGRNEAVRQPQRHANEPHSGG